MTATDDRFLAGFEFGLLAVAPAVVGRPLLKDVLAELRRMARGEKGTPDEQARAQCVLATWGAQVDEPVRGGGG